MAKIAGLVLLLVGLSGTLSAAVPEIDPGSSVTALALLAGVVLTIRGRQRT